MPRGTFVRRNKKVPVILDTDIGTDIDDTWAVALMLRSPELDVKLIVTETKDTTYRAKIIAKMLEIGGRTDIPVGVGLRQSDETGGQEPWVKDYDLSSYPGTLYEDGVSALIDAVIEAAEPITLIAIGPALNISVALEREPRLAKKARLVGMFGSIRKGYDGSKKIAREYNVASSPQDCQRVFMAPWEITITPLDTCGLVKLRGAKYRMVRDYPDPLTRAMIDNYKIWSRSWPNARGYESVTERESSTLFDTVAVYLAFSDEYLVMEKIGLQVTDDGYTVPNQGAKVINCAMDWRNLPAFENLLVKRLSRLWV